MSDVLVYSFSGEVGEVQHLFPSDRLARVAGAARAAGCTVEIRDCATFGELDRVGTTFLAELTDLPFEAQPATYVTRVGAEVELLLSGAPRLIFLNLWHGPGFKFSIDLARELRRRCPGLKIYGIGQKVDWFRGDILTVAGDALSGLVTGLGYRSVEALSRGQPPVAVPNLIYRDGDEIRETESEVIDVDASADPLFEPEVYRDIDRKIPIYPVELSNQACPNACAYCVRPGNYGRQVRRRDPQRAVDEVLRLRRERGAVCFRIEDSTPPPGALTDFARRLLESGEGEGLAFCAFCRIDQNRNEDFEILRKAGFLSVFFGLESLSDDVLARLRKGIHSHQIDDTLRRAHDAGLFTVGSLIFPVPGETEASERETLAGLARLRPHLDSALALPAGVYPATEWGRDPQSHGIRLHEDYLESGLLYPVKLLVPMSHWKPLPFSYDLMGKSAAETTFEDIMEVHTRFLSVVRGEYKLPAVPDYYVLLARLAGLSPQETARRLLGFVISRDYAGMEALLSGNRIEAGVSV